MGCMCSDVSACERCILFCVRGTFLKFSPEYINECQVNANQLYTCGLFIVAYTLWLPFYLRLSAIFYSKQKVVYKEYNTHASVTSILLLSSSFCFF